MGQYHYGVGTNSDPSSTNAALTMTSNSQTISGSSRRMVPHPGGESSRKMNGAIYHRNNNNDDSDATTTGTTGTTTNSDNDSDTTTTTTGSESEKQLRIRKIKSMNGDSWLGNQLIDPSKGELYLQ